MNAHVTARADGARTDQVLAIRHMSKTFPGTKALDVVDFDLRHGEVHALVGQNGCGKSTLIKALAGYHQPDPGTVIELEGEEVHIHDTTASRAAGFRFVHQDLGLVNDLNTVENLALGRGFKTGFGGRIDWKAERREAKERIGALGYDFDVRRPVGQLGPAERTGIAIARALDHWEEARILVVDEPTASLPRHEVKILFEAIDRVRKRGLGVIYVSHRLDEVFTIGDRVTVLRDGRKVGTYATSELGEERLVSLMIGGEEMRPPHDRAYTGSHEAVLEVRGLCGLVVDNVDLEARKGEVLGIAGLTGSGREEILPLIFGTASRHGEVLVEGKPVAAKTTEAIDAGIALVPAKRHAEGSITSLTVRANCTLTDLKRHSGLAGALRRSAEREEVKHWIKELDVRPPRPETIFATLSGGNQQKIVLAKWLRRKPRVLLLDEPTRGVDVHAKATIHALARAVAVDGWAVVIASSDDAELCDTCDRVVIFRDGRIAGEVEGERMTPEEIARIQLASQAAAAA
jgi:ribose transport system ATP-binding protein